MKGEGMDVDALEILETLVLERVRDVERENETLRNRLANSGYHPAGNDAFGVGESLPVPRVQMSFVEENRQWCWYTGIVTRQYWATSDTPSLHWLQIERTTTTGGHPGELLPEPYRGSNHLRFDAEQLALPAYVVNHRTGRWGRAGTLAQLQREGVWYVKNGALSREGGGEADDGDYCPRCACHGTCPTGAAPCPRNTPRVA